MKKFKIVADKRWQIVSEEKDSWRIGIYRPEFNCVSDIDVLEKHSCLEFFACVEGRMGILIYDGSSETEVILEPGDAITISDYHNSFCLSDKGYFIVTEKTSFTTDFIDRKSKKFLRTVSE